MYKLVIFIITFGAVLFTYCVSEQIPLESVKPEILKAQFAFVYTAEILFGCLLSGVLCLGKNAFEPYHIAQICIGFFFMLLEFCLISLIFTEIKESTLLLINAGICFLVISPLLLLALANYYSVKNSTTSSTIQKK